MDDKKRFAIWVDSDSMKAQQRALIMRRAIKEGLSVFFVADRSLSDVVQAIESDTFALREPYRAVMQKEELRKIKSRIMMVVVPSGADSADDYIVEHISSGNLMISHDIPLCARAVEKGALCLDDRGNVYTDANIRKRLSERDAMKDFREMGILTEKNRSFDAKTLQSFANAFDALLSKMLLEFPKD